MQNNSSSEEGKGPRVDTAGSLPILIHLFFLTQSPPSATAEKSLLMPQASLVHLLLQEVFPWTPHPHSWPSELGGREQPAPSPVPWPSGPPTLLLGSLCLHRKFSCLDVLRVLGTGQRQRETQESKPPGRSKPSRLPRRRGSWRKVQKHAEGIQPPSGGPWPARAPGWVLGGHWRAAEAQGGLCHRNNIFNTGGEREAHPALTRDSGIAVGCEHSRLGGGPMAWTRGMLLPRLPAGSSGSGRAGVPGLVDYK